VAFDSQVDSLTVGHLFGNWSYWGGVLSVHKDTDLAGAAERAPVLGGQRAGVDPDLVAIAAGGPGPPYGSVLMTCTAPDWKRTQSWVLPLPLTFRNRRALLAPGAAGALISCISTNLLVYTLPAK
jgi:hypothetical protein